MGSCIRIKIEGIVQGVGFRPFVHKIAKICDIKGFVCNTSDGALIEAGGRKTDIDKFLDILTNDPPALSFIHNIDVEEIEDRGYTDFVIKESEKYDKRNTLLSPDICICDDCLKELRDVNDRRYKYPFINCTNCGPRFTITKDVPYDRKNTTMDVFPMCDDCGREYSDITDRRYHAQPDACEKCGPSLSFYDGTDTYDTDCIEKCADALRSGKVAAIKGLGGFHLACLYTDEDVLKELRSRKRRDGKPFALMCKDIDAARKLAFINEDEEKLLLSRRRPIVLLDKKEEMVSDFISTNTKVGIMLPYTPLHYLLFDEGFDALVMTSANLSDLPIIYKNEEALKSLSGIADVFLMHNRDINVRLDDSVVFEHKGKEYFVRRSRGYVPHPVLIKRKDKDAILALGSEQKASFSLSKDNYTFISGHIGDLKNMETYEFYKEQIEYFKRIFDIKPEILACDIHPDYLSSMYADEQSRSDGIKVVKVQHHHAHMASCMADNGLNEKCIGIIFDGTGLGTDNTIWGSEFLVGDYKGFERLASIKPIKLAGGDKAIKETGRIAYAMCHEAGVPYTTDKADSLKVMIENGLNVFESSGMGRLFDGVSAILSICDKPSYEGEGAVLLESAAKRWVNDHGSEEILPYTIRFTDGDIRRFDWTFMVKEIINDLEEVVDKGLAAYRFLKTITDMSVSVCEYIREKTGIDAVVLSGGTFQNMILLKDIPSALEKRKFRVYNHRYVSANDEGISLGQSMIAAFS